MNTKNTKKTATKNTKNVNGGAVNHTTIDRVQVVKSRRTSGRFCNIVRADGMWTTPAEVDIAALSKEDAKTWRSAEGETNEDRAFVNMGHICRILGIALGDDTIKRIKKAMKNEDKRIKEKLDAEVEIIKNGRDKYVEAASERAGKRFDGIAAKWEKAAKKANDKKKGNK